MLCYKIRIALKKGMKGAEERHQTDDAGNRQVAEGVAARLSRISRTQMSRKAETYAFVSALSEGEGIIGVISSTRVVEDIRSIPELAEILDAIDAAIESTSLEEISLRDMRNLLEDACRRDFVDEDSDSFFESLGLAGSRFRSFFYDGAILRESMLELRGAALMLWTCTDSQSSRHLLGEVRADYCAKAVALHSQMLRDELNRIFADDTVDRGFRGHPVHYLFRPCGKNSDEMIRTLLEALLSVGRLQSRRYSAIETGQIEGDVACEEAFRCVSGSVLVIRIESEDQQNPLDTKIGEKLDLILKKAFAYGNDTLIVFCLPDKSDGLRDRIVSSEQGIPFVEIGQDDLEGDAAREYLDTKAEEQGLCSDEDLHRAISAVGVCSISKLDVVFARWSAEKLRTSMYPQYANAVAGERVFRSETSALAELRGLVGLASAKEAIGGILDFSRARKRFGDLGWGRGVLRCTWRSREIPGRQKRPWRACSRAFSRKRAYSREGSSSRLVATIWWASMLAGRHPPSKADSKRHAGGFSSSTRRTRSLTTGVVCSVTRLSARLCGRWRTTVAIRSSSLLGIPMKWTRCSPETPDCARAWRSTFLSMITMPTSSAWLRSISRGTADLNLEVARWRSSARYSPRRVSSQSLETEGMRALWSNAPVCARRAGFLLAKTSRLRKASFEC